MKIDYSVRVMTIDETETTLESFKNKTLLIVNTASKCGYTSQYKGLEALHRRYHKNGFSVLGFPCNQFGNQEPGINKDIATFCANQYNITFPMFSKINVNGSDTHPLYRQLKKARTGFLGRQRIQWNFCKFLISADGTVIMRLGPNKKPEDLVAHIETLLIGQS